MSEEIKVATETVSEETTQEAPTNTPDVGSLIAESKKYRQRSQEAEAKLAKLKSKLEEQEKAKMVEKEEWKSLYESEKGYKDKYHSLVEQRKAQLLENLSPDQQERFGNKDLDVIEFMVNELKKATPKEVTAVGSINPVVSKKPYSQMDDQERRAYYNEMLTKKR